MSIVQGAGKTFVPKQLSDLRDTLFASPLTGDLFAYNSEESKWGNYSPAALDIATQSDLTALQEAFDALTFTQIVNGSGLVSVDSSGGIALAPTAGQFVVAQRILSTGDAGACALGVKQDYGSQSSIQWDKTGVNIGAILGNGSIITRLQDPAYVGFAIKLAASQTANGIEQRTSADVVNFAVAPSGLVKVRGTHVSESNLDYGYGFLESDNAGLHYNSVDQRTYIYSHDGNYISVGNGALTALGEVVAYSGLQRFRVGYTALEADSNPYRWKVGNYNGGYSGIHLGSQTTTDVPLEIQLLASQTGDAIQVKNSADVVNFSVGPSGIVTAPSFAVANTDTVVGTDIYTRVLNLSNGGGIAAASQASMRWSDVSIARDSAGVLRITDGDGYYAAADVFRDLKLRDLIASGNVSAPSVAIQKHNATPSLTLSCTGANLFGTLRVNTNDGATEIGSTSLHPLGFLVNDVRVASFDTSGNLSAASATFGTSSGGGAITIAPGNTAEGMYVGGGRVEANRNDGLYLQYGKTAPVNVMTDLVCAGDVNSENILIGNTSVSYTPSLTLRVPSADLSAIFKFNSGGGGNAGAEIGTVSNQQLKFLTGNTVRGGFDTSGNFFLGTVQGSASNPMLKKNGAGLDFKLADDSDYATIRTNKVVYGQGPYGDEYISANNDGLLYRGSYGHFFYDGGSALADIGNGYSFKSYVNSWPIGWADAALGRNAAGVLEINNGTAGTLRDLKLRNSTLSGTLNVAGYNYLGAPNAAPTDINLAVSQFTPYLDETANNITFRARKANGTYFTQSIKEVGTTAGTVAAGDDSRITNCPLPEVITLTGDVTLTSTQVKKRLLVLRGALFANVAVTVPDILFATTILNETTGSYTVTVKRASTVGQTIAQNETATFYYDGL